MHKAATDSDNLNPVSLKLLEFREHSVIGLVFQPNFARHGCVMTDLVAAMAGQGLSGLDVTTLYPQASSPQATIIPGKLLCPVFFHTASVTVANKESPQA
jgi:hypothetical protein